MYNGHSFGLFPALTASSPDGARDALIFLALTVIINIFNDEEFYIFCRYNIVPSVENELTFRRNMSPPYVSVEE
jgi:hypothetical protein